MTEEGKCDRSTRCGCLFALVFLATASVGSAKTPRVSPPQPQIQSAPAGIKIERQDDSISLKPAPDLALRPEGERKAGALAHFVEGMGFEQNAHRSWCARTTGELRHPPAVVPLAQAFVAQRPQSTITARQDALKIVTRGCSLDPARYYRSVFEGGDLTIAHDPRSAGV